MEPFTATYQRLIDNRFGGLVEDLRTTFVAGEPTIARKRRHNHDVCERELRCRTCCRTPVSAATKWPSSAILQRNRPGWGGADVARRDVQKDLHRRCKQDGHGPPVALPLGQNGAPV